MGGEKIMPHLGQMSVWGSPPRGRGKAVGDGEIVPDIGITPAWAGKSAREKVLADGEEDHPRVGGEKTKKIP